MADLIAVHRLKSPKDEDISSLANSRRLAIGLCFFLLLADGFDVAIGGYSAPLIARDWLLRPSVIGPILSASTIGMLCGGPFFGWFGDRYGRRIALVSCALLFGIATLAGAAAGDPAQLIVTRIVAGIGIGGLTPNAITLAAECSPARSRATVTGSMILGVATGTMVAAAVAAVLGQRSWRILFIVGGVISILIGAAAAWLPKSVDLQKIEHVKSSAPDDSTSVARIIASFKSTIRPLFSGSLLIQTPLLWVCYWIVLFVGYMVSGWTPLLLQSVGMPASSAAIATAMYVVGGGVGGVILGRMIDFKGVTWTPYLFFFAVFFLAPIGVAAEFGLAFPALFLAGCFVSGPYSTLNVLAGRLYPRPCRATGLGIANGVGRTGAIIGPIAAGALLSIGLSVRLVYVAAAFLLLGACFASAILIRSGRTLRQP